MSEIGLNRIHPSAPQKMLNTVPQKLLNSSKHGKSRRFDLVPIFLLLLSKNLKNAGIWCYEFHHALGSD